MRELQGFLDEGFYKLSGVAWERLMMRREPERRKHQSISRKHVEGTRTTQASPPIIHSAPVPTRGGYGT
jgi:hypothetical protein